uniref:Uncharacterized protein n=1 Tax=Heterorhabditis bacteriophora TaxID=37862 RepID=A0A1I7XN56_HETBA
MTPGTTRIFITSVSTQIRYPGLPSTAGSKCIGGSIHSFIMIIQLKLSAKDLYINFTGTNNKTNGLAANVDGDETGFKQYV